MFKTIVVTVMLSVSCCACAYPVPSIDDHRSASSSPITVAGVVAIEQSPTELQRSASTDKARSIMDDTALRYARWAMFGTCASAAIALIQAGLFVWQLALMRRSTEDASEAAKAARDSASIANDMFTKLERPWIFLVAHRVERREGPPIQPQLANNYWVSLVFRNDGRSPAFVKGIEFNFAPKDQLAEVHDYSHCSRLETPATLPVGDSFETRKVGPSRDTQVELTMFGRLTYKDMAGTEHHTGFAINISPHIPAAASNENERYDIHD